MTSEEKEEKLILFAILQGIANELRRIKQFRQEAEKGKKQTEKEVKENEP